MHGGDVRFEDLMVPVPGGEVFVRRWRAPSGRSPVPVVLFHDSLGSVELWRGFPAALSAHLGRDVNAYDRLGFGRSSPRHGRPTPDFVRREGTHHFPDLKSALGLGPFVAFGHSVGGGMALEVAAHDPDCRAVVSESAQAFLEAKTIEAVRAAGVAFASPAQMARLARWHGDRAPWVLDAWTGVWLDAGMRDWSLDETLPRVQCPVLVIHGDQDEFGSVAFPERIVKGVSGPAQIAVLAGRGHIPHRECPEEVLRLTEEFLSTYRVP